MDNPNLLSTPEGYATPDQIKSTYDYAKALLYGNMQQPVRHWTQGVSNMISALVGGNLDYGAGQRERASQMYDAGQKVSGLQGTGAFQGDPTSAGPANNTGGGYSRAIAGLESGNEKNPYAAVGPATRDGDRAYGKYQVMGKNIPSWTQEATGRAYTPEEYLNDPQAQEAVFKHKFIGQYVPKYGPEGAARAWIGGEGGMNNLNATAHDPSGKPIGMSVGQYGQQFAQAFNGQPSEAPASQAIDVAARGGGAAPPGAQRFTPNPQLAQPQGGQQPYINPALIRPRTNYTPQALTNVIASGWLSQGMKDDAFNAAMAQGQPISVPYMGGAVIVDPRNPQNQQFIPEGKWGTQKVGDIEYPTFTYSDGRGNVMVAPTVRPNGPMGPRSEAAPTAAPTSAPAEGGSSPQPTVQNASAATTGGPSSPLNATAQAQPQAPVKVASLDQSSGVVDTVEQDKNQPAPQQTAAAAESPLAKMAQAGPPPGIDPEMWAAYKQKKEYDIGKTLDEEAGKKQIEFAAKKYDTLSGQAQTARKILPNIDLGLALMNDPNFHSGMTAGAQDTWARFKSAVLGDKYANAPNETFDKLMSGAILDNMRTALGGLGQVRLAEIALLTRANANRHNTDASNRAVLEISRRGAEKLDQMDGMAQQYVSGDEVNDPVTGEVLMKPNLVNGEIAPRRGLDAGFDKLARKFTNDHPSFSPEEIKRYNTIFDTGRDPNAVQQQPQPTQQGAAQGQAAPQVGSVKSFSDGKGGSVEGVWDGQKYVPKDQYKPAAPVSK